ncbi:fasciclin domain-containing protein [Flagellimonas allohymeniacidonis]|uniref:Fasciclin n=1 Tax=Flagellimonas allohymeniacidonis TaxID=2517819 RepID=A0A4Q8QHX4_9FLAO|nr:fasciclin domain-containing protein [Allomuricauda hymeniacidonis]TAI48263.1 fasciclin [Allomuricauda hymeniacidonis]
MKKVLQLRSYFLLMMLSLFTFSSCDNEDDGQAIAEASTETQNNIVETAQNTEALNSLVMALAKADENADSDLIGTLSGEGPFTVFAPTNEAFSALLGSLDGFDSLDDFDTDEERELLAKILQYHVVLGAAVASTELSDGQAITTVQGEDVVVDLDGGVFIGDATDEDAQVIIPDVSASNGIVHVINKVLLPQEILDALSGDDDEDDDEDEEELGNLVELVVETEALSLLEAAVIKADLVGTLSGDGPFTVFAPTDDAFVALLDILGDDYSSLDDFDTTEEIDLLRNILLYHVIPAKVLKADLAVGDVPTAFAGNNVSVIKQDGTFVIGDASEVNANITGTDFMASNGVAHTIDKVLLPQAALDFVASLQLKTIVEIAVETDDLSLLVEALQTANAGLVETLSGDGPFTVFAPTNAAFIELLDILGDDFSSLSDFDTEEELDILVKVLTYHVVVGTAAFKADLSHGQQIETFQGENVGINIKNNTVHIVDATDTNATVVIPDVEASNGVVHVINKVLLPQEVLDILFPPTPNIVELAQSVDDLSLLVDALIQADAGLVGVLSGEGPFTVFAPTNEAFVDLLNALGDQYNSLDDFDTPQEKELLAKILTYHVVAGQAVASGDLKNHQRIHTVQGEDVIAILNHGIFIRDKTHVDAEVIAEDNFASNGVVHIIDKVLLPQEVLDALH